MIRIIATLYVWQLVSLCVTSFLFGITLLLLVLKIIEKRKLKKPLFSFKLKLGNPFTFKHKKNDKLKEEEIEQKQEEETKVEEETKNEVKEIKKETIKVINDGFGTEESKVEKVKSKEIEQPIQKQIESVVEKDSILENKQQKEKEIEQVIQKEITKSKKKKWFDKEEKEFNMGSWLE